jgi:hypothetical protein
MNLRKRCCTRQVVMMVLHQKLFMFLGRSKCMDKLRILSLFVSPILLLQDSIRRKHSRKSFVNLISIPLVLSHKTST